MSYQEWVNWTAYFELGSVGAPNAPAPVAAPEGKTVAKPNPILSKFRAMLGSNHG